MYSGPARLLWLKEQLGPMLARWVELVHWNCWVAILRTSRFDESLDGLPA